MSVAEVVLHDFRAIHIKRDLKLDPKGSCDTLAVHWLLARFDKWECMASLAHRQSMESKLTLAILKTVGRTRD